MPKVVSTRRPQHKPKLGQHFLADDAYAAQIVDALGDVSQKTVLEIGPGRGVLTSLLAKRVRRLIAVELDRVLAAQLRLRFGMFSNVEVIEADILSIDFDSLFGPKPGLRRPGLEFKPEPVKVVGNLPYYITSQILLKLAASHASLDRAILMVQREVADRVTAKPCTRDYGLLSVTVQLFGPATSLFTLPPDAFSPPPDVHSTVFRWRFAPRFAELGVHESGFLAFVRKLFAQKRKTLSNNLRAAGFSPASIVAALNQAAIDPRARAEALPVEILAALWHALQAPQASLQVSLSG